jgi:hypothetical protein
MSKSLYGTGYENYNSVIENIKEVMPYYDTSGTIEGQVSTEKELYGIRQWLIHRYFSSQEKELRIERYEVSRK